MAVLAVLADECLRGQFQLRVMSFGFFYTVLLLQQITKDIPTVCRRNSQNVLLQKLTDQLETVNKEKQLIGL
jgi:hypothetical protein